jgi:hypothetical protein
VRQGDVFSPNLFKLFINDLANIFDDSRDPPLLFYLINLLKWARHAHINANYGCPLNIYTKLHLITGVGAK